MDIVSVTTEISTSNMTNVITLRGVEGSSFSMGNSTHADPVHTVCLSSFYIGKYEITQAQYQEVIGSNSYTSN